MFKLTTPLVPLVADGGGADLPPIDQRPFKPAGDNGQCARSDTGLVTSSVTGKPNDTTAPAVIGPDDTPDDVRADLDALVIALIADGTLVIDPTTGEYKPARRRAWRWPNAEEQSWSS